MKKIIFIDNDLREKALEDVSTVKRRLKYQGKLTQQEVETVEVISDFNSVDIKKAKKIIFNPDNCICTWSMYTANHYGSLYQLLNFLVSAGKNSVKDIVYFDGSGNIHETLKREIHDEEDVFAILNAIETNNIITVSDSIEGLVRLRVKLNGYFEDPFYFEEIDMRKLLDC